MEFHGDNMSFLGEVSSMHVFAERRLSSYLQPDQMSWTELGIGSSQQTFSSHSCCNKILILMMEGENHPRTSKVLVKSDANLLLVIGWLGGSLATVRRKWFRFAFHSTQVFWHTPCTNQELFTLTVGPEAQEVCAGRPPAHLNSTYATRSHDKRTVVVIAFVTRLLLL